MNITFIGYGNVGAPLADHLERAGNTVTLAAANPQSDSVKKALARNPALRVATAEEAVTTAEVVFLATPFDANQSALNGVSALLNGKILVDCTNPVGPGLTHGLHSAQSGSEFVQTLAPGALVVRAFSIYGFENFDNSVFPGYNVKPVMMLCGADAGAKQTVSQLATALGWEPLDVGGIEQALHLEHLALLWIRMVRVHGISANTVWAVLKR